MEIKSLFQTESQIQARENGVWVDNIPNMGDMRLKVRSLKSRYVRNLYETKARKVPRNMRDQNGELLLSERERIGAELLFEAVLLDWDGLTDEGKALKYSPKLAREWCTNPGFSQFADAVTYAATIAENVSAQDQAEVLGN